MIEQLLLQKKLISSAEQQIIISKRSIFTLTLMIQEDNKGYMV